MPALTEIQETVAQQSSPGQVAGIRFLKNTASNFAGQAVIMALTFFSTPYITRTLGAAQYGALSLLMTYLFSFSLLNLGINASLVKYLAELLPKGRREEMQRYLSTSLTVLGGVGLVTGVVVCALASSFVTHFFKGAEHLAATTVLALRIASAAFVLQFLCQVASAVIAAAQRFEILNLIRIGFEVLRIGGTVALLHLGCGLPELLALVMLASTCALLAYAAVAGRLVPGLKLRLGFSSAHFRTLIGHSRYVLVGNASNQIVFTADSLLIGYFLPAAYIAYYAVAQTIALRLWTLVGNVASVVFPAASALSSGGETERVRHLYVRGIKVAAAVACYPAFALCLFSREFLLYWLGPEYATNAAPVLSLLALGFLVNSFSHVPYQTLQSTHYAQTAAKASTIYTAITLVLLGALVPAFGIIGAAAGFLTAQLLFVPWLLHTANRLLGVRGRTVITQCCFPVLAAASLACACALSCRPWIHSLVTLGLAVALGLGVYVLVTIRLALDPNERAAVRLLLKRHPIASRCFE